MSGPRTLAEVRADLDGLDRALVELLARRVRLVREAFALKQGGALRDEARERAILDAAASLGSEHQLPEDDLRALLAEVLRFARVSAQRPREP